jgi:hypothetical protein
MVAKYRQWLASAAGLVLALSSGCLTLDGGKVREAPTGTAVSAATTWQNYVVFGPDAARDGKTIAGLVGRLYLFSQSDVPITETGKLEVRLYPDLPNRPPTDVPLNVWRFDPEILKGRLQRDAIGWGYSLVLPWDNYRPDLTHVRLTVRFDPARGGMPLYAPETRLTLHGEGPPQVSATTKLPGGAPNAVANAAPGAAPKQVN